jgi:hypothetical protein
MRFLRNVITFVKGRYNRRAVHEDGKGILEAFIPVLSRDRIRNARCIAAIEA